jgi:hypothetical protein
MTWDLGFLGIATLLAVSVAFGLFAHFVVSGSTTRLAGVISAVAFFVAGVVISEVVFGWATERDLQPNIDGLSFDEVLAGGLVGVAIVVAIRYLRPRRGWRAAT